MNQRDMIPAGEETSPVDDTETEESQLLSSMQALLAESETARVRVKLYRVRAMTKKLEWCEDFTPDQIQEGGFPMIRAKFGPGDYQMRLIGPKGLVKTVSVSIAADSNISAVPAPQSQQSEFAALLRVISEQNAQIVQALQHRPEPADRTAQLKETLELLTLAQGLGGAKPAADPMAMFREMMGAAREMKEFQKEIADPNPPQPPEEDSLLGIIRSVAPIIQSAVSNPQSQPQAGANFPPLQPLQLPASIEHGAISNPHAKGDDMTNPQQNPAQLLMLGIIEDLCDMAKAGKTATEGAEFALDSLPDEALPVLRNRYGVQALALQFPIVKDHEEWFKAVRVEAVRIMDSPEPEETTADPALPAR